MSQIVISACPDLPHPLLAKEGMGEVTILRFPIAVRIWTYSRSSFWPAG